MHSPNGRRIWYVNLFIRNVTHTQSQSQSHMHADRCAMCQLPCQYPIVMKRNKYKLDRDGDSDREQKNKYGRMHTHSHTVAPKNDDAKFELSQVKQN